MQKEIRVNDIAFGESFTYKGINYNKIALTNESQKASEGFIFGISGLKLLALYWSTKVMVDVRMVELEYIAIGQKFMYEGKEFIKVNPNYRHDWQYGLNDDNNVMSFGSNPIVELVE